MLLISIWFSILLNSFYFCHHNIVEREWCWERNIALRSQFSPLGIDIFKVSYWNEIKWCRHYALFFDARNDESSHHMTTENTFRVFLSFYGGSDILNFCIVYEHWYNIVCWSYVMKCSTIQYPNIKFLAVFIF